MSFRYSATIAAGLSLAMLALNGFATAADLPVKAEPKIDAPFFSVIDDRVTFSWLPKGTSPGIFSIQPNGTVNGTSAQQLYSFTHFDAWAYGTNSFYITMLKGDHNFPANPCSNAGSITFFNNFQTVPASCAGATQMFGGVRSTFGWNEIFNTRAFTMGPLRNISFLVGMDAGTENTVLSSSKRDVVAGLQFAFDLPYKGYINVSPMVYWEFSHHNAYTQCGWLGHTIAYPAAGANCLLDGNRSFDPTWSVEANYYMDLGFLPETMQFFAISGRASVRGSKGCVLSPLNCVSSGPLSAATQTEFNSEPIRLTFDASKAFMGPKYSHFIDLWVAYRYWQNKFGEPHNAHPGVCIVTAAGPSTNTCTESSVYTGVTVKF